MPIGNFLYELNILTQTEIEQFVNLGKNKTIAKNDFFIKEGQVCNNIAFVNSGTLRTFYYSGKGDEITYCLTFPGSFMTAYSSLITQKPSYVNIQAMTDAELLIIPKAELEKLEKSSRNWLLFSKTIAERYFVTLENRLFTLQHESAEKRYKDLVNNRPDYIRQIPLKYLASYLGITQRHLSRIRREIAF